MFALGQALEQCEAQQGGPGLAATAVRRRMGVGREVAVVGAGATGMACALRLATLGHEVVLYEARARAQLLDTAAPLARHMMDELAQLVAAQQVRCVFGRKLGVNLHMPELHLWHDAVFLAVGLASSRVLGLSGARPAALLDTGLLQIVRADAPLPGLPAASHVLVLGAGAAALALAVRLKQAGVSDVTLALRHGVAGDAPELELAHLHQVRMRQWLAPLEPSIDSETGALHALRFEQTRLRDGRLQRTGGFSDIVAGAICKAASPGWPQQPNPVGAFAGPDRIIIDQRYRTCQPGVYAGGDCVAAWLDAQQACQQGIEAATVIDGDLRA